MADLALSNLKEGLDCILKNSDHDLAKQVIKKDDEVDPI